MINQKEFNEMNKEYQLYDSQREELIKKSRDVLKLSKRTIYAVHRDNLKQAESLSKDMKKELKELNSYIKKNPKLYNEGSYKVAIQEYVEAMLYFGFVKDKKLYTRKELDVETDYYLLGLCDLTGELARKAISNASNERYKEVKAIKDIVSEIYEQLLSFDIRSSELRKKFDAIKYDLKRLDDLFLELKLREKL
ncbi:hypothetical protein KY330_03060 [Candidatus Woesearchaeota archaeon]|nr:hypothetical protein [Candidatus Woesearchaeota archaeon]